MRCRVLIVLLLLFMAHHFSCGKAPRRYYRVNSLWTSNLKNILPFDYNNDGQDELTIESTVQIDVMPQNMRMHYDQGLDYLQNYTAKKSDLALFVLRTQYNKEYNRGLLAYNMREKQEVWRFTCGPQIITCIPTNLDADAAEEIVIGTYAPEK